MQQCSAEQARRRRLVVGATKAEAAAAERARHDETEKADRYSSDATNLKAAAEMCGFLLECQEKKV